MNVRSSTNGKVQVKLTKPEEKKLKDAQSVCKMLASFNVCEQLAGTVSDNIDKVFKEIEVLNELPLVTQKPY